MADTTFEEDEPVRGRLRIDVEGYEGPLDVLLTMARDQKVDIVQISILQLADQYLGWIAEAQRLNLELAADYLVMASWLAYLKSRLLLPDLTETEEPSGEELAAALAFQLRRLEGIRDVGGRLMARTTLGRDRFARGTREKAALVYKTVFDVTLFELLQAYSDQHRRQNARVMSIEPSELYSMEEALDRLRKQLGRVPDWAVLSRYLPGALKSPLIARSAIASTFSAALELAREGKLMLRQDGSYAPIYIKDHPESPS